MSLRDMLNASAAARRPQQAPKPGAPPSGPMAMIAQGMKPITEAAEMLAKRLDAIGHLLARSVRALEDQQRLLHIVISSAPGEAEMSRREREFLSRNHNALFEPSPITEQWLCRHPDCLRVEHCRAAPGEVRLWLTTDDHAKGAWCPNPALRGLQPGEDREGVPFTGTGIEDAQ